MTAALNLALLGNNVNSSGQVSLTAGVNGTLPVSNGGTGLATLPANNVLLGNGTSTVQSVAPGASGNVLISNGTTWIAAQTPYVGSRAQVFTSSGTFSIPTGVTAVKVTVVGGGGGSGAARGNENGSGSGGAGGAAVAIKFLTGLTPGATLGVTVGSGGTAGTSTVNGGAGGFSRVASGSQTITTIQADGGNGTAAANGFYSAGGAGGGFSGADFGVAGQTGAGGALITAGSSLFGMVAVIQPSASISGQARSSGTGYGAGAKGATSQSVGADVNGAAGTAGIVIWEW